MLSPCSWPAVCVQTSCTVGFTWVPLDTRTIDITTSSSSATYTQWYDTCQYTVATLTLPSQPSSTCQPKFTLEAHGHASWMDLRCFSGDCLFHSNFRHFWMSEKVSDTFQISFWDAEKSEIGFILFSDTCLILQNICNKFQSIFI